MKNYYNVLGVATTATAAEIRSAFRRLAREYHPDQTRYARDWATERFEEINEAYVVLRDPERRREHDRRLFGLQPRPIRRRSRFTPAGGPSRSDTGAAGESFHDQPVGKKLRRSGLLNSLIAGTIGQILGLDVSLRVSSLDDLADQDEDDGSARR